MPRVPSAVRDLAVRSGTATLALRLMRRRPVILLYHGVSASPAGGVRNGDGKHIEAERFEAQVAMLARCRRIVTLGQLVDDLQAGRDASRAAVITFDDGYENNVSVAAPILARHGAKATFFLSTGYVGASRWMWTDMLETAFARTDATEIAVPWSDDPMRVATTGDRLDAFRAVRRHLKRLPANRCQAEAEALVEALGVELGEPDGDCRFMSWEQARALAADGHEIGAHTITHPILSRVPLDVAAEEILGSRDRIAAEVGACSDVFAYPNGKPEDYTSRVVAFCREHFRAAVSTTRGWVRADEPFALRRLAISGGRAAEPLEWTLLRET